MLKNNLLSRLGSEKNKAEFAEDQKDARIWQAMIDGIYQSYKKPESFFLPWVVPCHTTNAKKEVAFCAKRVCADPKTGVGGSIAVVFKQANVDDFSVHHLPITSSEKMTNAIDALMLEIEAIKDEQSYVWLLHVLNNMKHVALKNPSFFNAENDTW